jgi:DNA polymerase V
MPLKEVNMEHLKLHKSILCIDLKSFYASVECALMQKDPFKTPLVVADITRGDSSVVLAVSPYLKTLGIPSRCRLRDIPKDLGVIIAKPRMKTYMQFARDIIEIYLNYVSADDLHVYSIDEVFLDLTPYLSYYKKSAPEIATSILNDILTKTHITATCGIGPNMLLAKLALDLEAKYAPNFMAIWTYDDVKNKLWNVARLSDMWGIGSRMEKNLNRLGIQNVYELAHSQPNVLKHHFGIIGEELYYHAHGIDMSLIQDRLHSLSKRKSFGQSQVLFKDYYFPDIALIIRETVDEVSHRMRMANIAGQTISLGVGYSLSSYGGFHRQIKLGQPTLLASHIYEACMRLFHEFYDGEPIRRIHVSVSSLVRIDYTQLSLFDDVTSLDDEYTVFQAVDQMKLKYGKNAINRASSELEASTIKARNHMVGGHHE